jgi:hypothetical protein
LSFHFVFLFLLSLFFHKYKILMERKCSWSKYGSVLPFIFHIQFGSYFLLLFFYFFYWFFFNFILNHWFHMIFILYLILILLIFLNPSTNYILFQFYPSSFILIFFMLNLAHIFFNDVYLVLDLYFILNFINWHFFLLGHGFWRFTRIDFSPFTKLLFFQFHPLIFDFCGIVLRAFFFLFPFFRIIQILCIWSRGWWINPDWLKCFFYFFF